MPKLSLAAPVALLALSVGSGTLAAPVYLNQSNISVAVGAGTSAGSFNNTFDNGQTINKVIDAPNAAASEFHNQTTHIWFTAATAGGGLELLFDFNTEYDISTLHFWNYDGEGFDVDNVDFTFFNGANAQVGTLSVQPALGASPAIFAQDILLAAPLNVRYVRAFLTGSNRQVDFQNIGFTADVSTPIDQNPVSSPGTLALAALGLAAAFGTRRRR
jgi:MYXO-CTERM domain-containing protein